MSARCSACRCSLHRTGGGNVVFESLEKQVPLSPHRKLAHVVLTSALLPFAAVLAIAFGLPHQGDIMRVYCTKGIR